MRAFRDARAPSTSSKLFLLEVLFPVRGIDPGNRARCGPYSSGRDRHVQPDARATRRTQTKCLYHWIGHPSVERGEHHSCQSPCCAGDSCATSRASRGAYVTWISRRNLCAPGGFFPLLVVELKYFESMNARVSPLHLPWIRPESGERSRHDAVSSSPKKGGHGHWLT